MNQIGYFQNSAGLCVFNANIAAPSENMFSRWVADTQTQSYSKNTVAAELRVIQINSFMNVHQIKMFCGGLKYMIL